MSDGDSKKNQKIKKARTSSSVSKRHVSNVSSIFQSLWVRCGSIFPDIMDGKFMEGELRFVLYCGIFLWSIYLLFTIAK